MGKLVIGLTSVAVAAAVVMAALNWFKPRMVEQPHPVVVAESANVLKRAGTIMQGRGDELIATGQPAGDDLLVAAGQQWKAYGANLEQEGQWMSMDPTAPGNLVTAPTIANWTAISQTATAMLYDPKSAGGVDLDAAERAGMALRSEGENMIDYSHVIQSMVRDTDWLTLRHGPNTSPAELQNVTQRMAELGQQLVQNGDELIDFAQQLRPPPFGVSVGR